MKDEILFELQHINAIDDLEREQLREAVAWIETGAPIFRTAKPAIPDKHLVSYFVLVDQDSVLLVDHKNAKLWLPTGGHVEPDEHPRDTVVRELKEELGISVNLDSVGAPLMVTSTTTVGLTAGHTDVSLWYVVRVGRTTPLAYDQEEFHAARWFKFSEARQIRSDPHLSRFLSKLSSTN